MKDKEMQLSTTGGVRQVVCLSVCLAMAHVVSGVSHWMHLIIWFRFEKGEGGESLDPSPVSGTKPTGTVIQSTTRSSSADAEEMKVSK